MSDNNLSDDYATGETDIDRESIEIASETLHLPGAEEGSILDMILDFDVEWLPGGDYVIFVIANGLKVHAVYNDRDAVLSWVYEQLGQFESFAEVQSPITEAVKEYEHIIVLGHGSWIKGLPVFEASEQRRTANR